MNPNNQIIEFFENNGIIEFTENIEVIENIVFVENPENPENLENIPINEQVVFDLGPMPVLRRHNPPVYFGEDAGDLLEEGELQEYVVPDDFVKPAHCPRLYCSKCYWAQCSGTCAIDTPFIQAIRAAQLAFEEEMDLPPPPALSRISAYPLLDEEWRLPSSIPPLTRCYTNAHLLEDKDSEQDDTDDEDEFDMLPEGIEYVCLLINKDKDKDEDNEQDQEDKEQDK